MTLLALALLLAASALVSGSETAVFSLRAAERRRLAAARPALGALLARPAQLLATLLVANLVINVAYFTLIASLALRWQDAGHTVAALALGGAGILGLVMFSEILPKTLALIDPDGLVRRLGPLLLVLSRVLFPLVALSGVVTSLVESLLLGGTLRGEVGRRDFKSALRGGAALGRYHAVELALLHDVVDFGDRRARAFMVPRVEVAFLDLRASPKAWRDAMAERPFTDYPVVDGGPDGLVGTINAASFFGGGGTRRTEFIEPALMAPLSIEAERLVLRMQSEGRRLAILIDEHGGVAGVVGFAQLLTAVLGEVVAPAGGATRPRGSIVLDGATPLHELEEAHGLVLPSRRSDTLAGAMGEALGRVPRRGDEWLEGGWRLRVISLRGRRVERVLGRRLLSTLPPEEGEAT